MLTWQGRLEEAEPWIQQAERALRAEAEPTTALGIRFVRGLLELARGRDADALTAFRAAERLGGQLAAPNPIVTAMRARAYAPAAQALAPQQVLAGGHS